MVILDANINTLKFLLGILNSKLPIYYIKEKYASSSYCGGITFSKDMINSLPIPTATPSQQQPIIALVEKILAAKKQNPQADTTAQEAEIDKLVYELYGLGEEEIKVVEGI